MKKYKQGMKNARRLLMVGLGVWIATAGGLIVSSCTTTQTIDYSYPVPSEQDIGRLIMEWDLIEKKKGKVDLEFNQQYAKALKALSDAISDGERWRARAESK